MSRVFMFIAALSGGLSVGIGAFAAHGLKNRLSTEMIETVKIGAQYQMYHAIALMFIALLLINKPAAPGLKAAGWAFILGTLLFSGSLYALALGGPRWLGPITPLGGLCFLIGWGVLAIAGWRMKSLP